MTPRARISLMIMLLALSVGVVPSLGHTDVTGTDPASGEALVSTPPQVVVTLSSPPGRVESASVVAEGQRVSGPPRLDPGDARQLVIPITRAAVGDHTAEWVLIAADGHRMTGSTAFTVAPMRDRMVGLADLGLLMEAVGRALVETRAK